MRKLNAQVYNWLIHTYTPTAHDLGLTRILYVLFLLLMGLPHFEYIASMDVAFFNPPPGISLLTGPIENQLFWQAFDWIIILLLVFLLLGIRTKITSLLFGMLMLFGHTYIYSYGKIDHNIYAWLVPVVMAFSNWGNAFSLDAISRKNSSVNSWPLVYLSFLLGFGYFTAAIPKIIGDWWDPSRAMTEGYLFRKYMYEGQDMYLIEFFVNLNNHFIYKSLDYSSLIFEVFFIFTILCARWFFKAAAIAAAFHIGVLLLLNIAFSAQMLAYIPFIVIFYGLGIKLKHRLSPQIEKYTLWFSIFLSLILLLNIDIFAFVPYRSHCMLFILGFACLPMLLPSAYTAYKIRNSKQS